MITRTKTPQLDLLPILNLLRITIPPLHRHLAIRIRIHQDVERAIALQLRQKRHRGRDLSKDGLNLCLDLRLCLLRRWLRAVVRDGVFLVGGFLGRGSLRG